MKWLNLIEKLIKIINGALVFDTKKGKNAFLSLETAANQMIGMEYEIICRSFYSTKNQVTKIKLLVKPTPPPKNIEQRSQEEEMTS